MAFLVQPRDDGLVAGVGADGYDGLVGDGVNGGFIDMVPTFTSTGSAVIWTNSYINITNVAAQQLIVKNNK